MLEAIAESSEMVTLSEADKASLGVREMNIRNKVLPATMDDCSILSRSLSPSNKPQLQPIKPDPQLNTLKYIDETLSHCKSLDSTQHAGMGESYLSRNSFLYDSSDSCETIARDDSYLDRLAALRLAQLKEYDNPTYIEKVSVFTIRPSSSIFV